MFSYIISFTSAFLANKFILWLLWLSSAFMYVLWVHGFFYQKAEIVDYDDSLRPYQSPQKKKNNYMDPKQLQMQPQSQQQQSELQRKQQGGIENIPSPGFKIRPFDSDDDDDDASISSSSSSSSSSSESSSGSPLKNVTRWASKTKVMRNRDVYRDDVPFVLEVIERVRKEDSEIAKFREERQKKMQADMDALEAKFASAEIEREKEQKQLKEAEEKRLKQFEEDESRKKLDAENLRNLTLKELKDEVEKCKVEVDLVKLAKCITAYENTWKKLGYDQKLLQLARELRDYFQKLVKDQEHLISQEPYSEETLQALMKLYQNDHLRKVPSVSAKIHQVLLRCGRLLDHDQIAQSDWIIRDEVVSDSGRFFIDLYCHIALNDGECWIGDCLNWLKCAIYETVNLPELKTGVVKDLLEHSSYELSKLMSTFNTAKYSDVKVGTDAIVDEATRAILAKQAREIDEIVINSVDKLIVNFREVLDKEKEPEKENDVSSFAIQRSLFQIISLTRANLIAPEAEEYAARSFSKAFKKCFDNFGGRKIFKHMLVRRSQVIFPLFRCGNPKIFGCDVINLFLKVLGNFLTTRTDEIRELLKRFRQYLLTFDKVDESLLQNIEQILKVDPNEAALSKMGAIFESTKIFEEQKPPSASLKKFKDETALHMAGRIWRPFANEPFTTVHDFKSVKAIAELVDSLLSILDRAKGQSDDRIYHYAAITICNQLIDEITGDNKPSYVEIRDGVKVFNDRFAYLLNEFYTKSPDLRPYLDFAMRQRCPILELKTEVMDSARLQTVLLATARRINIGNSFKVTEMGKIFGVYHLTMQYPISICTKEGAWIWFARLAKIASKTWPSWLSELLYVYIDVTIEKLRVKGVPEGKIHAMIMHVETKIKSLPNAPGDQDVRDRIMNRIRELNRSVECRPRPGLFVDAVGIGGGEKVDPVLSTISEAMTEMVRVQVKSFYDMERSDPVKGKYMFRYKVRITNEGSQPVHVIARNWEIGNCLGIKTLVQGSGVNGEQPIIDPGLVYTYESECPLEVFPPKGTRVLGSMFGTYTVIRIGGTAEPNFAVQIGKFNLILPDRLN